MSDQLFVQGITTPRDRRRARAALWVNRLSYAAIALVVVGAAVAGVRVV